MRRDVVVNQPTAAMLNDHKHIQQTKGRGHSHEEIAGNNSLSVQAQESRPAQISSRPTSRTPGKILEIRCQLVAMVTEVAVRSQVPLTNTLT
jgi:hypothetical protein